MLKITKRVGGVGREGKRGFPKFVKFVFRCISNDIPREFCIFNFSQQFQVHLAETRWTWMIMSTPFSLWRRLCAIGLNRVTWSVTNCYRGERAHG